jgi:hypothetical protein
MSTQNITELDAAIIAEEQGWDYTPACDEAFLLLADNEEITVAATPQPTAVAPQRKVNKRQLRAQLIRETMVAVRDEEDDQSIGWHMINDDRWTALFEGKDRQAEHDYVYGVIRFCERALRYNQ